MSGGIIAPKLAIVVIPSRSTSAACGLDTRIVSSTKTNHRCRSPMSEPRTKSTFPGPIAWPRLGQVVALQLVTTDFRVPIRQRVLATANSQSESRNRRYLGFSCPYGSLRMSLCRILLLRAPNRPSVKNLPTARQPVVAPYGPASILLKSSVRRCGARTAQVVPHSDSSRGLSACTTAQHRTRRESRSAPAKPNPGLVRVKIGLHDNPL